MLFLKYLLKTLLLPPSIIMVGVLVGLFIMGRRRRTGMALVLLSVAALYSLSVPVVAEALYQTLLKHEALDIDDPLASSEAIIVLTGGSNPLAPEYGKDISSAATVERARYAAYLHRRTGKPILVAGGRPKGTMLSEAETVRQLLEDEMQTPVLWLEEESKDTDDSAAFSMKILSGEKIKNIVLITHGYHMLRAEYLFKKIGFNVVPAPIGLRTQRPFEIADLFPSASGLAKASFALNEWYGFWWYSLKNFINPRQ